MLLRIKFTVLSLLCVLAGCPGGQQQPAPAEPPRTQSPLAPDGAASLPPLPEPVSVAYPPMVADYLLATLRTPLTEQHAGLAQAWDVVAGLAGAHEFGAEINRQLQDAGNDAPLGLIAAWLATDRQASSAWLQQRLAQGHSQQLAALQHEPELGRRVLYQHDWITADRETCEIAMSLLRSWEPALPGDSAMLQQLAQQENPRTSLRAIGYLIALDAASEQQRGRLKEALRSDRISVLAAAVEACRICRDESLAATLVSAAAKVPLASDARPGMSQPDSTSLYSAYALTYLPGEQAGLLRRKLLEATDVRVRWQARLGELLHGDPQPWYDALLAGPESEADMWLTLQPESVVHPALLLSYKQFAGNADPEQRLLAARHLNRYAGYPSERLLRETLELLVADELPEVAVDAWHSAARCRAAGLENRAQQLLDDTAQPPMLRLGAAYYLLRMAEPEAAP